MKKNICFESWLLTKIRKMVQIVFYFNIVCLNIEILILIIVIIDSFKKLDY